MSLAQVVKETWKKTIARSRSEVGCVEMKTGSEVEDLDTDIDSFLNMHHGEQTELAVRHLEPWVTLSGQALLWLSHLHMVLHKVYEKSSRHRAAWALTGLATANVVAVRKLVLAGLDTPARALLRALIESLAICVSCLDDSTLADKYVAAQGESDARALWQCEFTTKVLTRRFKAALLVRDEQFTEMVGTFIEWLESEKRTFSQGVHSSYMAAALTCYPKEFGSEIVHPGCFGQTTTFSFRTLATLTKMIWLVSQILSFQLVGSSEKNERLLYFDPENEIDVIVVSGYFVLNDLVTRYGDAKLPSDPESNEKEAEQS